MQWTRINPFFHTTAAADTEFPMGGTNSKSTPTYYLAKFHWKLHENEENLTERGVCVQNFTT